MTYGPYTSRVLTEFFASLAILFLVAATFVWVVVFGSEDDDE